MATEIQKQIARNIRSGEACPKCGHDFTDEDIGGGRCQCGTMIVAAMADECDRDARNYLRRQNRKKTTA